MSCKIYQNNATLIIFLQNLNYFLESTIQTDIISLFLFKIGSEIGIFVIFYPIFNIFLTQNWWLFSYFDPIFLWRRTKFALKSKYIIIMMLLEALLPKISILITNKGEKNSQTWELFTILLIKCRAILSHSDDVSLNYCNFQNI